MLLHIFFMKSVLLAENVACAIDFVVNNFPLMFQLDFLRQGYFKILRHSVVL
jgi:hypothetical protein